MEVSGEASADELDVCRGIEMSEIGSDNTGLSLYTKYEEEKDGTLRAVGYAYGASWVQQALLMDDMKFETPEAAKEWWEKNYG